eukprot:3587795-Pleurochrysis_carterae.AAC.1
MKQALHVTDWSGYVATTKRDASGVRSGCTVAASPAAHGRARTPLSGRRRAAARTGCPRPGTLRCPR